MEQSQRSTMWSVIRKVVRKVTRSFPRLKRAKYSDFQIASFYFWGTLHGQPMTWAVDPLHHSRLFCPRRLPSISQLNRRIAADRFQRILQLVHERLAGDGRCKGLIFDGQALTVSPVSRDRDAAKGHVPGGFAKGYKLHAMVTSDGNIPVFSVVPLNHHELPVARRMLASFKHDLAGTLAMADGNYDAADFHKDIHRRGGFLITSPRGRAKHPVTLRQMGQARRLLLDLWERHPRLMKNIYRHRKQIERRFGNLASTPGLLGSLPKSVRGLARVRRYVGAKICLYHAHRIAKNLSSTKI